ncbi:MAG: radical SAM protein [Lachnospiraceae bacterium]|nr:radical SAM protein [Lachnospiraceae bacterium]
MAIPVLSRRTKKQHMTSLAEFRGELRKNPRLRFLFIEMTNLCNERCRHCGSRCGETEPEGQLSAAEIKAFLKKTKEQFDIGDMQLCITGGEPLLRKDFFEIMEYAHSLGYHWGMTSNATLIDEKVAKELKRVGLGTISVSIDGLPKTHDWFRQTEGGFDRAMAGLHALHDYSGVKHLQVTTVVHKKNIEEIPALHELLKKENILKSWRVINMDPIGRAKDNPDLKLEPEDYKYMMDYIRTHYDDSLLPTVYGCAHYLGLDYEREVRKWYFLCNAGIYTASIMWNGDIAACLDVERRPELIQGNIRQDDFKEVWLKKFSQYRTDWRCEEGCKDCKDFAFCAGGAFHTWNFEEHKQNMCFKGILF